SFPCGTSTANRRRVRDDSWVSWHRGPWGGGERWVCDRDINEWQMRWCWRKEGLQGVRRLKTMGFRRMLS
ncbi:hypothetical protein HN51_027447, partial [Arachis hypogaea]